MSKLLAGLGGNAGAVVAGGGMVVAIALGAYIGLGRYQEDKVDPFVEVSVPEPSQQAETVEPTPAPESEAPVVAQDVAVEPQKPSFDELRRETDGTTLIAGRAEPLSEVKIIVDGAEVAKTTADSTGGFAAIAVLPPKDTAQIVSLSSVGADDAEEVTVSLDEIILAPSKVPVETTASVEVKTPVETKAPVETTAPVEIAAAEPENTGTVPLVAPQTEQVSEAVVAAPVETVLAELEPVLEPELELKQEPAPTPKPARVAVLKSDAQGVSLLNPVQNDTSTSIALDTIGYSDQGDVQLTGRAQPDSAKVRVYLDNRSVISLPVDTKGRWRGDLPDVDAGIYTLRVDEVSTQGDVSSRVETPFKRESAEVLAQASNSEGPIKSITVQTGATLWAIARERYGDGTLYVRVFEANASSIRNPDLIYPGQVFDLPN
jgi:nucleoid-associated protein YgaU